MSNGILRGIHFQKAPFEQGKLIKVITGEVLDVAVDLRPSSPTFGQHEKVILSAEKQNMFFIPEGFGHGFLALKDSHLFYKCTRIYRDQSGVCGGGGADTNNRGSPSRKIPANIRIGHL